MKNKFIAISEDEYNSFKHGGYERKIKELEDKIDMLEEQKIEIARAKAIRYEVVVSDICGTQTNSVSVYSDTNFENEILEDIRNTKFSHIVNRYMPFFHKSHDFIVVEGDFYFKNGNCERLEYELSSLSCQVKSLQQEKNKLEVEIKRLKDKLGEENATSKSLINRIIEKFGKGK